MSYAKFRIGLNPQHGGITGTNRGLTSETAAMVVALDWPLGRSIIPTHLSLVQEIVHPPQVLQSLLCFLKTHTIKHYTMKTFCTRHCKRRHGGLQNILAAAPPSGQNTKRWHFAAFTHLRPRKTLFSNKNQINCVFFLQTKRIPTILTGCVSNAHCVRWEGSLLSPSFSWVSLLTDFCRQQEKKKELRTS